MEILPMNNSLFFNYVPALLQGFIPVNTPIWDILNDVGDLIIQIATRHRKDFDEQENYIFIGKNTSIADNVIIKGPAIIGENCEIRRGAYLRENIIICNGCTIGNSTEIKNAILFESVQAPHFNYVGDAVLGNHAHLGAGVILSNFRLDKKEISVTDLHGEKIATGRDKLSAIIGDNAEIGCNSVINPGTILEKNVTVYPLTTVRGYHKSGSVIKNLQRNVYNK
jgi:NDP-sugar pyrophosphorylase family protein